MTLESSVEGAVIRAARLLGGRAFKLLPWVQRGLPDRLVVIPGAVWFIETKAPKKRLASHQRRMQEFIQGLGLNWATLDTRDKVEEWTRKRREEWAQP